MEQWRRGQLYYGENRGKIQRHCHTANGCRSYDTLQVVNVFANPVVALNHSPGLCVGESRVLDAGDFAAYSWNTAIPGELLPSTHWFLPGQGNGLEQLHQYRLRQY